MSVHQRCLRFSTQGDHGNRAVPFRHCHASLTENRYHALTTRLALTSTTLSKGLEQGKLTGKIQILQELFGEPVSTDDELLLRDRESLMAELAGLQARLRRDT